MSKQAEFTTKLERESQYIAFLQRKVDIARASMSAGEGLKNDEGEAKFAARRARAVTE